MAGPFTLVRNRPAPLNARSADYGMVEWRPAAIILCKCTPTGTPLKLVKATPSVCDQCGRSWRIVAASWDHRKAPTAEIVISYEDRQPLVSVQ